MSGFEHLGVYKYLDPKCEQWGNKDCGVLFQLPEANCCQCGKSSGILFY